MYTISIRNNFATNNYSFEIESVEDLKDFITCSYTTTFNTFNYVNNVDNIHKDYFNAQDFDGLRTVTSFRNVYELNNKNDSHWNERTFQNFSEHCEYNYQFDDSIINDIEIFGNATDKYLNYLINTNNEDLTENELFDKDEYNTLFYDYVSVVSNAIDEIDDFLNDVYDYDYISYDLMGLRDTLKTRLFGLKVLKTVFEKFEKWTACI